MLVVNPVDYIDLIETLWNVKEEVEKEGLPIRRDLIETLWNVKSSTVRAADGTYKDLIETLWNVKRYK